MTVFWLPRYGAVDFYVQISMWPSSVTLSRSNLLPCLFLVVLNLVCFRTSTYTSVGIINRSGDYSYPSYSSEPTGYNRPHQPYVAPQFVFGIIELPTLPPDTSGIGYIPQNISAIFCRSTTARAHLDCPCLLIGEYCLEQNSICKADSDGDGLCSCETGYLPLNGSCVTVAYYNQNVLRPYVISSPVILASCFLPANSVVGNIPHIGGTPPITYNLTLLFTNVNGGSLVKFISIDSATGNILLVRPPPAFVLNQTYSVTATDASGRMSSLIFKVAYNCTPPTCSIDVGSPIYVECQISSVGSTIGTVLASGTVAPTRFSMVLVSSTSTLGNTYYQLDPFNGMIQIKTALHGGIFSEVYNVSATNAVGQSCPTIQVRITTSADCT